WNVLIFSNFFSSGGIFCILFFAVEKKDEPARLEDVTKLYLFRTVLKYDIRLERNSEFYV
ncbi:MAG: hypothetical protein DRI88_10550, partial [Bacteroidetes bacterium]